MGFISRTRKHVKFLAGVFVAGTIVMAAAAGHAGAPLQAFTPKLSHGPAVKPFFRHGPVPKMLSAGPRIPMMMADDFKEPVPHRAPVKESPLPSVEAPTSGTGLAMPSPAQNFAGLDLQNWGAGYPPDPVGDVGPNHFVQAVNTAVGIYSKTGTRLAAFTFNQLWAGVNSGTKCDANNNGDPQVAYDHLADRWFVSDLGFSSSTVGPYYHCIAVSATNDPVSGGWYLYAIQADDATHAYFPDYPKVGVWPDGFYMSANEFNSAGAYAEVRGWAFNRGDMETGAAVRYVILDTASTTYFSLQPSNVRGANPPAGRENFWVSESQTAFQFQVFKFHVDYSGSGSTFTGPTLVSQSSYLGSLTSRVIEPSPGNQLDTLADRVMMRVQYRSLSGVESLWVSHTVHSSGTGVPYGTQWAQITVTAGTVGTTPAQQQIMQNATNGGLAIWMASLATDRNGDMAIGYSVSNSTTNPGIRYNGRLVTDALNSTPQGETVLQAGTGVQSGNCGGSACTRWGDYSSMDTDPNDCTFWFTTEYYAATGLNWQTRIGSFAFPSCTPANPAASLSASTLAFGNQQIGVQSSAQTETITNTGTANLILGSVTVGGANAADFAKTSDTCSGTTVAPAGTCQIQVKFTPGAAGARSASLNVPNNVPGGNPSAISLTGAGVSGVLSASPSSLGFGNKTVGATTAPQAVTVTNTGSTNLTIGAVALSGANAGDFAETTDTCSGATVLPSGTCTIAATFTPATTGARSANLSIPSTSPGSPTVVPLTGTGVQAAVSASPSTLAFGGRTVGATSSAQTTTVTNTGTDTLTISTVTKSGANAADFAVTADTCTGASISPSSTCAVSVTFTPSATGARSASLSIASNAPTSPTSVSLTGTGLQAQLSLSASTLPFGSQRVGTQSAAQTETVTNTGTDTLSIGSVSLGGANPGDYVKATDTCTGANIAPGGTCTVQVQFAPAATGSRAASLSISSNAPGSPATVALTGTGIQPALSASPSALAFGNQRVGTTSGLASTTITNTGTASLNVSSVSVTGVDAGDFSVSINTCTAAVAPGGSCSISAVFSPSAVGSRIAGISIASDAPTSPDTIVLMGTGVQPESVASPSALGFGTQTVDTTSSSQTVTVTNTGTDALSIGSLTIGGGDAGDFSTSADTCSASSVAPGSSCTVDVSFAPSTTGARSASLSIPSDSPTSPDTVALSGTGTQAAASVTPSSLAFGSETVDATTAAQTVTVTNSGTDALDVSSVAVSGANAGDFAIDADTCTGAPVPAGGSCTIGVAFTPSATGARAASLDIASNAPSSPDSVSLSGTGIQAGLSLSDSSLGFGSRRVGSSSAAQTVTVTNSGTDTLSITGATLGGGEAADFASSADTCTGAFVAPGDSCSVDVTFTPSATGDRNASLSFTSNAPSSPDVVSLAGTGTLPAASIDPAALDFGSQLVATTSGGQTITVTNTGTDGLTVGSVALAGVDAGQFAIASESCTAGSVAPGDSCTVTATFSPSSTGSKTASIQIVSDAPTSPDSAVLMGSGIQPGLMVDASSVDFGDQQVGSTSAARTVTVTNSGTSDLVVSSAAIAGGDAADFAVGADTCSDAPVAPGDTCRIDVTFAPSAVGARTSTLSISSNAPSNPDDVSLSGNGTAPSVTLSAASISFGGVRVGTTSSEHGATVANSGTAPLVIGLVSLTGDDAAAFALSTDDCTGATLLPGQECAIGVTASPASTGDKSASVSIPSDASSSPDSIALDATGIQPQAAVDPSSLGFGDVLQSTSSAPMSVTVANTGTDVLSVGQAAAGGDFAIGTDECSNAVVPIGGDCIISVTFTPSALGARSGMLSIPSDAVGGTLTVELSGTGVGPDIAVSPSSLSFAVTRVGTQTGTQSVTITNPGTSALNVGAATLGGANEDEFVVVSDECSGATVQPGGTCSIGVAFKPAADGSRSGSLDVSSDAGDVSVALAGTGDGHGPSLEITSTSPVMLSVLGDALQGTVSDEIAGVGSVTVVYTPIVEVPGVVETQTVQATLTCDGPLSCTWSAALPSAGLYTASVTATDKVGNGSGSVTTTFVTA